VGPVEQSDSRVGIRVSLSRKGEDGKVARGDIHRILYKANEAWGGEQERGYKRSLLAGLEPSSLSTQKTREKYDITIETTATSIPQTGRFIRKEMGKKMRAPGKGRE